MPRTVRPTPETLQLRVTSPPSASERTMRLAAVPLLPWPLAAAAGGALAAVVGWLVLVGVIGIAWVTAITIPLAEVLAFCSQLWLLGHGGGARIGGATITLVPLGLTLAAAGMAGAVGRFAGSQARLARPTSTRPGERFWLAVQVAVLVALGYAAIAAVMALTLNGADLVATPALGGFGISLAAACIGALRALGLGLDDLRPRWLGPVLAGGLAGAVALVAVGAVVVGLATGLAAERVAGIEESLKLGTSGGVVWAVAALGYLPTLLVWGLAWALGGGITVGTGSLVSLSGTKLGMLPAIPLLGALPEPGVAPAAMLGWLASGAVVGIVSGVVAVRRRGRVAPGPAGAAATIATALGAGVTASGLLLVAAWAATGGLGGLRLAELGPRLPEVALIAPPVIVGAAVLTGLLRWLVGAVRSRRQPSVR